MCRREESSELNTKNAVNLQNPYIGDKLSQNVTYLILAQSKFTAPPLANFRTEEIDPR